MATLGPYSTTNQYIKFKIEVIQNSQSVSGNTSNVTVKVFFYRTNTGYTTYGSGTVYCKINGTEYTASVDSDDKITNSGKNLFTKTLNIAHNSDGTKSLAVQAKISHSQFDQTTYQGNNVTLTTIPRKSTLSVGNGTLGTEQTLTVTRQSTGFTHTIVAKCGDQSTTIASKSTSTSIKFTPPLAWASENTTGTSVSVTYTITTYNGSTSVGSDSYTKTCSIPSSVKPTCSFSFSDPAGYALTYGGYVQGYSKIQIAITASGSQGSTIKSYKTTVDGKTYTAASFTTGVLSGSGTLTISVTVTDSRGRTATASKEITVLAYSVPKISSMTVKRCDANGNSSSSGGYLAVVFSASITSLNSKNTAEYSIQYKKTNETNYGDPEKLTAYNGKYSVSGVMFIFEADKSSSYDVMLTAKDAFKSIDSTGTGSSIKKLWSKLAKGLGLAIGKVAELEGVFEVAFQTKLTGGILMPVLPDGTDLDTVILPNAYSGNAATTAGYLNCPITTGTSFTLEVFSAGGTGQLMQRITSCTKGTPVVYIRCYYSSSWGDWVTM